MVFLAALSACASPPEAAAPPRGGGSEGLRAPAIELTGAPELVLPGVVSTPRSEVKLTASPGGDRVLFGAIGWEGGRGGWDVLESARTAAGWGAPVSVAFDSPSNDFDPSFAPDGSGVYFFSNRPGGLGGDDIYFAPFDAASGRYGEASNLGPAVNSAGDEWGPVLSPDGRTLLFCTDGRGGAGRHDLFVSRRAPSGAAWGAAERLDGAINGPGEDFDPTFLHDGATIVFASGATTDAADLHVSFPDAARGVYGAPRKLPAAVNPPGELNFGPSIRADEPMVLYFTSTGPVGPPAAGRADLYRVRYRIAGGR